MPNWKFHNNWAESFGIPRYLANSVNKREDMPKIEHFDDPELQEQKESMPDYQPTYEEMEEKGPQYLKAWILHLALDELENISMRNLDNLAKVYDGELKRNDIIKAKELLKGATIANFTGSELLRAMPGDILDFIMGHLDDIVKELPTLQSGNVFDVLALGPNEEEAVPINPLHRPGG